jgi:ribose transport system substrate-binding protein
MTATRRLLILYTALAVLAAACASAEDPADTAGRSTDATEAAAADEAQNEATAENESADDPGGIVSAAVARIEEYTGPREVLPSDNANTRVAEDVSIGVISCLEAAEGCARVARGVVAAGEAMGWEVLVFDGQGTPEGQNAAFARALAGDVDAVVLSVVDAQVVESEIERAKDAGVLVIGAYGHDVEPPLFDAQTGISLEASRDDGRAIADYVIAESGGEAQIALFRGDDFITVEARGDGFEERIAECPGCEIVDTQQFLVTDITTRLPTLAANTVQANQDLDWVVGTYDVASEFIVQGLEQADLLADLRVASFDGNASTTAMIREGGPIEVTAASTAECYGYHAVDIINSMLAGEGATERGCPEEPKLIVAENAPEEGAWQGDADWEAAYLKRWGVD